MSVDELRAGLARLAEPVLPDSDPYGQLLRAARRRRRNRFTGLTAALVGVLATALLGPTVLSAGSAQQDRPDPPDQLESRGHPVDSPWGWRLIQSPTRGNLAGNQSLVDELTGAFAAERSPESGMSRSLPEVKVLFAHDFAQSRAVVVAYYSDTAAGLVTRTGRRGATVPDLVRGPGRNNLPVRPFTVLTEPLPGTTAGAPPDWTVALAPSGCRLDSSTGAFYSSERGLRRTWQPAPNGDHLVHDRTVSAGRAAPIPDYWRVSCDGRVRQQGPTGGGPAELPPDPELGPRDDKTPTAPEVGPVDPALATAALYSNWRLVGIGAIGNVMLLPARPVIRWAGRLPGDPADAPPAAVVAPESWTGPATLHLGTNPKTLVAVTPAEETRPTPGTAPADQETQAASRAGWSLAATAMATAGDLVAVRIPVRAGGRAVLSDQLLVVGPPGAATVEVVDNSGRVTGTARFSGGAAVLSVPFGAKIKLRCQDAAGEALGGEASLFEPAAGERLFGESIVSAW